VEREEDVREIKFRAWDKILLEMRYDIRMLGQGEDGLYLENYWDDKLKAHIVADHEDFVLMQFTGLLDKNGKEIYEGDIIKIPDNWSEYGFNAGEKYEIYFAYGGFRCKPKRQKLAKGYWLEDDKTVEIIGNRFETTELIK
jgi:uncharacterized phage protein (TIGR01671 family)